MSQQTYPLKCDCGATHRVTSGQAGSSVACACGKGVSVPSYSVLRTLAADDWPTADVELDARRRLGQLPLETECVLCGTRTDGVRNFVVELERPQVSTQRPIWLTLLLLPLGWIGWIIEMMVPEQTVVVGEHKQIELPVRVCGRCGPRLYQPGEAKRALQQTPLYARLLRRHPKARLPGYPAGEIEAKRGTRKARRFAVGWFVGMVATLGCVLGLIAIPKQLEGRLRNPEAVVFGLIAVSALVGTGVGYAAGRLHRRLWPE